MLFITLVIGLMRVNGNVGIAFWATKVKEEKPGKPWVKKAVKGKKSEKRGKKYERGVGTEWRNSHARLDRKNKSGGKKY